MTMSRSVYMHVSIAIFGLTANPCPRNGLDHLRIVECPDRHKSLLPHAQVSIIVSTHNSTREDNIQCEYNLQQNFDNMHSYTSYTHTLYIHSHTLFVIIHIICTYNAYDRIHSIYTHTHIIFIRYIQTDLRIYFLASSAEWFKIE